MLDTVTLNNQLTGVVGLYSGSVPDQAAAIHRSPVVYLSDAHKLLRPDMLKALGPNLAVSNPPAYDPQTPYTRYDVVAGSEGRLYESVAGNNIGHTLIDPLYWRETSALSAWYSRIERGAITKLALTLALSPPPSVLLPLQPLYNSEGNLAGRLTKSDRFCGLRLSVKGANTAFGIVRAGIQLSGPVTNLPLYVFHSESFQPVAVIPVTGTTSGRTIWAEVGKYLYERQGGYYLVGYFESDLPVGVNAIGAERGFGVAGCSSCMGVDYAYAQQRSAYVQIKPVFVDSSVEGMLTSGVMSWGAETVVSMQSWGINMVVEARCDATPTLLENRDMLTNALLFTIACDVLEEISTSDRVNAVAASMRSQAYVALYGQDSSKSDGGLSVTRNKLVADLKAHMARIAPTCLPADPDKPRGITFRSAF